ncbi:hypothetical protein [Bowmanella dokdonensis]|uniref:Uncharacterized protein n=1 Tax=Bowmanella dokdonensis TaxID=751969 RepID=A0A939DP81_9ALTE|nr:hypothetical protein [Bowmanella dokdonensis]MBN7825426.1 hypothetical protein [Bowmanella dokdonensis]
MFINSRAGPGMLCALFLYLFSPTGLAEPYLAYRMQAKCSTCHVNPLGGGMRNEFGAYFGYNQLPASVSDLSSAQMGRLTDFVGLGGDLRYNAEYQQDDSDTEASTFRMDSAQLYLALKPSSNLTFYLDQRVAPGSAINREALLMYRFDSGHYVKAGKMYAPVGLRLEDDEALVRQTSGYNFDSSDNGVEVGLEFDRASLSLFVMNGTSAVSNNDKHFLYGLRGEYLLGGFRLGSTLLSNPGDQADELLVNLYGGWSWREWTLLAEADLIRVDHEDGTHNERWAGLFEVNYQWRPGLNLKLTSEYLDPDRDIEENQQTRYSVVVEYTPLSNLQLRMGWRSSQGIPQQPERSTKKLFAQAHLYF